jgi:hypothetical protein
VHVDWYDRLAGRALHGQAAMVRSGPAGIDGDRDALGRVGHGDPGLQGLHDAGAGERRTEQPHHPDSDIGPHGHLAEVQLPLGRPDRRFVQRGLGGLGHVLDVRGGDLPQRLVCPCGDGQVSARQP